MLEHIEAHVREMGGNLTHGRRVLHLCRLIAERDRMAFDEHVLMCAAYFHDAAAYPKYKDNYPKDFDHATESAKLIPELCKEYGLSDNQIMRIIEAAECHNKAEKGACNEAVLIRNADGVDYLGYVAVARDFQKNPNDMAKALSMLKQRKEQFYPIIDLPCALELAAPRVEELERFIKIFEEECFGLI